MPATMPASDLSEAPDDWLRERFILLDEDAGEDKFAREIEAIYRLREDRRWRGSFEETKAELIRRGLREPDPEPEFMTRSATVAAVKEHDSCTLQKARRTVDIFLTPLTEDGRKWITGRQWYRIADVKEFLALE
jgi:hypothetical protein